MQATLEKEAKARVSLEEDFSAKESKMKEDFQQQIKSNTEEYEQQVSIELSQQQSDASTATVSDSNVGFFARC